MSHRVGLGRHRRIADNAGDPLEGLVNLFDIGVVLAVAFLVAGIGATVAKTSAESRRHAAISARTQPLRTPADAPVRSGRGVAVGTVYRLASGQLVYVTKGRP
jgi:hypothetical protein